MKFVNKGYVLANYGDVLENLSLLGACEIVQDAVCRALELIKCDNVSLKNKYNSMWVFTKNKMLLFNKLKWNEDYIVESYICKVTKITIVIETVVYNMNKEACFVSKIEACPLDRGTKKIKRVRDVGIPLDYACDNEYMNFDFDKFDLDNGKLVRSFVVESTNLDMSMHCNNTEYVRLLSNCYNADNLSNMALKEFSIIYTKEAKEGYNLDVYKEEAEGSDLFEIKYNDNICVKAMFKF